MVWLINSSDNFYVLLEADVFSEEVINFNLSKLLGRTGKFLLTTVQVIYGVRRRQFHRYWKNSEGGLQP